MTAKKSLGNRMKIYEQAETGRAFLPGLPVVARLDGRSFHSFTKGLERPYDKRLSDLMVEVTKHLVGESCACIGYTQSDEISLVFYSENIESQIFFDCSIFKMTSVLASMASVKFSKLLPGFIPEKKDELPLFDCRAWNVPSKGEAINALIWRELDATRNSISMAAQVYYSHEQLIGKDNSEMQEMLFQKGINWNDYQSFFKRGVFIQRRRVKRKFTIEDLDALPPKHNARVNPNLEVERTEIRVLEMPPLAHVENREEVIFEGGEPVYRSA
jgi:tRNA(His) 5'-end guanylyltransferase